jgi:hypothetical protein
MRVGLLTLLLAALLPGSAPDAIAACGCPGGGVPLLRAATLRGNDLDRVRGGCAAAGATVELQVRQQHFHRRSSLPVELQGPFEGVCINGCRWTTIASTKADPITGRFAFVDLDRRFSVQLLSNQPGFDGLDGVRTDLRVRSTDPATGRWTRWTEPPTLEAFEIAWDGQEGSLATLEARVQGARRLHLTIADGPDDGDEPTVELDVDTDTPNFWLQHQPGPATVVYHRTGTCSSPVDNCPPEWLVQLSPAIVVDAPAFQANAEYPFVLGMVTASRPGAMTIATALLGERETADFSVDVDVDVTVDVTVDIDLGFDFFSIF